MEKDKQIQKEKKTRASVLDTKIDEINKFLSLGVSLMAIHKIINGDLPGSGVTYSGLFRYCRRKKLIY